MKRRRWFSLLGSGLRTYGVTGYWLIHSTKTIAVEEWCEAVFNDDKMAVATIL